MDTKTMPHKIIWCWMFGHDHEARGSWSMCWRCGQLMRVEPQPVEGVSWPLDDVDTAGE